MFITALKHKKIVSSLTFSAIFAGSGLLSMGTVSAATGSVYVSPGTSSVQAGNTITFSIRVNPGTTIDSVQGSLSYEAGKLQFVSINTTGSAFSSELQNTQSSGSVNFARGDFSAGVSSDSLIETVSFKALASNGSGVLTLVNTNADSNGTFTNPSTSGATVNFTAVPCPAGQTGTPPNCHSPTTTAPTPTPTPTSGGSTSTGTKSPTTGSTSKTPTSTTNPSTPTPTPTSNSSATPTPTATASPASASDTTKKGPAVTVVQQKVDYTQAALQLTSKDPTKVYIKYGINGDMSSQTMESSFDTSHTVSLDPSLLLPGETYSYVVVATDQTGASTQSVPQTLTLKGMTIKIALYDSKRQPLRNKTVTLHSKPYITKTDANGYATFSNVIPGNHEVTYDAGKQAYKAAVKVTNNVQSKDGVQIAPLQNAAVVYNFEQGSGHVSAWVFVTLLLLVAAASFTYIMRERLLPASLLARFSSPTPASLASILPVTAAKAAPSPSLLPKTSSLVSPPPPLAALKSPTMQPSVVSPTVTPPAAIPIPPPPAIEEQAVKKADAGPAVGVDRPSVLPPGTIVKPGDEKNARS